MCGIAGVCGVAPDDAKRRVDVMLRAMAHRGPDGQGVLSFAGGAAGMVRLALVDLSPHGQQPIYNAARDVAIVFNGEMYNWRKQRALLVAKGHAFGSMSDTEVVLKLFEEHDTACFAKVRGMFGLAVFDWRGGSKDAPPRIVLARDALGVKPLYVVDRPQNALAFASELRALLRAGLVSPDPDPRALTDYLSFGRVLQPTTFFAGARMLEPGTSLEIARDGTRTERSFYTIPRATAPAVAARESLADAAERLKHALAQSIRLHALADAPVGAFLSGGVDSSAIVGLMRQHVSPLRTYALSFSDAPEIGEAQQARAMAQHFGTSHTDVAVSDADAVSAFGAFTAAIDQPSTDGFNTWLVARAAAHDVKGVLSGVGGDELFAGYPVVSRMHAARTVLGQARARLARAAAPLARVAPTEQSRELLARVASRTSPLSIWAAAHTTMPDTLVATLLGRASNGVQRIDNVMRAAGHVLADETVVGKACLLDTRVFMGSQLLIDSDATSMAHSLELRVPFVDVELMAFARDCSDAHKLTGADRTSYQSSGAKRVLLEATKDLLPADFGSRPKRGFDLPFARWMHGGLAPQWREALSTDSVRRRGWLNPAGVDAIVARYHRGERALAYPVLWNLFTLEMWARAMIDRREIGNVVGAA